MEVPDMRKLPHKACSGDKCGFKDLRQGTDRLGSFAGLYRRFD